MPDNGRLVSPIERLLAMQRTALFRNLCAADLEVFAEHGIEVVYRKGDVVQAPDRPVSSVILTIEGDLDVTRDDGVSVRVAAPGGFGGLDIFGDTSGGTSVVAATEVIALRFDGDLVLDILEDNFAVLRAVLQLSGRTLIDGIRKIQEDHDVPDVPKLPACPCVDHRLDLVERLVYLRRMPMFVDASLDAMTGLARACTERRFPAGYTLWREGEPSMTVLFIVAGEIRGRMAGNPAVARYHPYGFLGGLSVLAGTDRLETAVTETPVVALSIDGNRLLDAVEDNFAMGLSILRRLSHGIMDLQRRLWEHGDREVRVAV